MFAALIAPGRSLVRFVCAAHALTFAALAMPIQSVEPQPRPVIARLVSGPFPRADAAMNATVRKINSCASHVVARELTLASSVCDQAVTMARWRDVTGATGGEFVHATALANRATLELLRGNPTKARADVAHARKLAPREAFVMRNELAIEQAIRANFVAQHLAEHSLLFVKGRL